MTNTNCLENIQCPTCGNEDRFRIAAKTMAVVTDDGTENYGDMEWDYDSYAECTQCLKAGKLRDFVRDSVGGYFVGPSGKRHTYSDIAARIRQEAPHTLGKHIFVQLEAIGLLEEMQHGTTPCGLPFTFAEGTAADEPAKKPYSVLLLYPDHGNDSGTETYYAFVEAPDPLAAVAVAQRQAAAAQIVDIDDPDDFAPLLVTEGHHASQPLFNQ